jgi:cold shock protein
MSDRHTGVVKWFNNERGYGFVLDGATDSVEYFVHFSSVNMEGYKTLKTGQPVTFELKETEKGVQAVSVELA